MREHITRLGKSTTVLLATHLAEDVQATATDVLVLGQGVICFDGPLTALLARAAPDTVGLSALENALVQTLGDHQDDLAPR